MRNTIIVSVFLFVAVVAASVFYFSGLGKGQKEVSKPLTFMPKETLLITAFKNDETTDNIFRDFEIFEAILGRQQQQNLQKLKQKFLRSEALNSYFENTDIFVSFHEIDGEIESMYTLPSKELPNEVIRSYFTSLSSVFDVSQADTLGHSIYSLRHKDSDSTLHVGLVSEIVFATYSKTLLLKVLDQKQPKLSKEQISYYFDNTNRNVPFSMYFAHDRVGAIAKQFSRNKPGDFIQQFLAIQGQSTWNISYKQDALILTGESELSDKDSSYIALFAKQRKIRQRLYQSFPANTAMYMEYAVSDTGNFRNDLRKLLEKRNEYRKLTEQLQSSRNIAPYLGGEFAIAELSNRNYLGWVSIKDSASFVQNVERYAERTSSNNYRFRNSNLLYALYGDALKPFQRPYFAIVGNTIVLANASSTLDEYLKNVRNQNLLIGTIGFKNVERIQSNEANVTFFLQTKNTSNTLLNLLPRAYANIFRDKENYGFQDFYSWSAQLSGNNGDFVSSIYAGYKSSTTLGATPEWTYQLNHRLITRPYVFEHSDTSQFILLQEQDHTVHGIHPNGSKLWSSVFSGRIVGDVIQSADRSIILVTDRNRLYRFYPDGKPYSGFSTGTAHEPTGTPFVTDIAGTPTILIPTRQQILAYTFEGSPAENWKPANIEGQLIGNIFRDNQYIVVGSTSGKVYYLNTDGTVYRTSETQEGTNLVGQLGQILNEEGKPEYIAMDTKGQIQRFSLDHSTRTMAIPSNEEGVRNVYFQQLVGSLHPELIIIQNNKLSVFDLRDRAHEIYHYNFTREINRTPLLLRNAENQPLLGISSGATGLIYLLAENGNVVGGFPIEALPLFYYGKINYNTGNFLLCSRRDHKLYAYRH